MFTETLLRRIFLEKPVPSMEETELFRRYLPAGWTLEDELALFAVQPIDKQRIVEQRIKAIDRYLDPASEVSGNVEAAACAIGVGRRQFFKFLAKLRQLGPTRGLSPGFRNAARRSIAREGLAEPLDSFVRQLLADNPQARIAQIEDAVLRECERTGTPVPGESAVRRRVHALKRLAAPEKLGPVGEQITVDQVNLNLSVEDGDVSRFAIATLIIDHETKLILGHGLTAAYGQGEGLRLALDDAQSRMREISTTGVRMAESLHALTWIAPRDLQFWSWILSPEFIGTKLQVDVIDTGPRRHGAATLRLIGDRLSPFAFKPMAMERFEAVSSKPGVPLADARRLVRSSVDRWNEAILARLPVSQRPLSRRGNSGLKIVRELHQLFDPVFEAVEDVREMWVDAAREPS
jgi:hypothetical protein